MKNDAVFPLCARRAGVAVLALWLTLLAAVLLFLFAPITLRQCLLLTAGLGLLFLALCFLAFGRLRVSVQGRQLQIVQGTLFPLRHAAPLDCVLELWQLSTPLLRCFGCCVAVLHLPGVWLLLPGISNPGWAALQAALRRGRL